MSPPVHIVLVGCGEAKRDAPAPARHLYTGPQVLGGIREALATVGEQHTAILSAEHGLVHLDAVLETYNTHLKHLSAEQRETWARGVVRDMQARWPAESLHVTVLASRHYAEALRPHLPEGWTLEAPWAGKTNGGKNQWLSQQRKAREARAATARGLDVVACQPTSWLAESRGRQLRYFLPDCDDRVDPDFDFATDTRSAPGAYESEVYAHQLYPSLNCDGLLVSRMEAESPRAKAARLAEVGVHRYLRVPKYVPALGDCGAFGYAGLEAPPYTTADTLDYYTRLGFDMGVSLDHIARVAPTEAAQLQRWQLTLANAADFLKQHHAARLTWEPVAAVQGWSPATYAEGARQVVAMGYRYLALGGLVMAPTEEVLAILQEVKPHVPDGVGIHLFGLAREEAAQDFLRLGVRSVDSTSPLRRAWTNATANYLTLGGEAYAAVRVPYTDGRAATSLAGGALAKAQRLERECLEGVAACDVGPVPSGLLDALEEYEALTLPGRKSMRAHNLRTLEEKPWQQCPCALCQRHGVQVLVFRGNDRNRRRGFHNVWVWYRLLGEALKERRAPVVAASTGAQLDLFTGRYVAPSNHAVLGGAA